MNLALQKHLARDAASFASIAQRYHFVEIALVTGPILLIASFLAFPFLGRWQYQVFHLSCVLCFFVSLCGIAAWFALRSRLLRAYRYLSLPVLCSSVAAAVVARIFGDFYWAFSRGYFLD